MCPHRPNCQTQSPSPAIVGMENSAYTQPLEGWAVSQQEKLWASNSNFKATTATKFRLPWTRRGQPPKYTPFYWIRCQWKSSTSHHSPTPLNIYIQSMQSSHPLSWTSNPAFPLFVQLPHALPTTMAKLSSPTSTKCNNILRCTTLIWYERCLGKKGRYTSGTVVPTTRSSH